MFFANEDRRAYNTQKRRGYKVHWVFVLEELSGQGGVETVLSHINKQLCLEGDRVTVMLPVPSPNILWQNSFESIMYYDPIVTDLRKQHQPFLVRRALGLRTQLEYLGNIDVVVGAHLPYSVFYSRMALGNHSRVPLVSWIHNPLNMCAKPEWIQYADLHWAISNGIGEQIQSMLHPIQPIFWVGNPFPPANQVSISTDPRFVYFGRLENQQKRIDLCLESLSHVMRPWTIDVFGDGPDRQALTNYADKIGIGARCTWHGWRENAWDSVEEASALLLTSIFEAFPMVIGEALSRGLPVISSDCDFGPREMVQHSNNGMLFSSGDGTQLAAILNDAVNNNRFLSWSYQTRDTMQNYSPDKVVARMRNSVRHFLREV